jgi:DNA-binding NarL/FixJ family response regulator
VPLGRVGVLQAVLGSELKREIVRRLAAGDKDEAIARGLGISLRTCRRYIAEILSATGAVSRFQAGFRLARERRTLSPGGV